MKESNIMWKIFANTGYINAYLFYKNLRQDEVQTNQPNANYVAEN
ncbi:YqzL family protein [Bacillota bacterium LX-D]|nr:YqzL family protein [Bacillota bacterium LX-D]